MLVFTLVLSRQGRLSPSLHLKVFWADLVLGFCFLYFHPEKHLLLTVIGDTGEIGV